MSAVQNRELVIQAVLAALWQRPKGLCTILHSDRGCRFTSHECGWELADNASAESFLAK